MNDSGTVAVEVVHAQSHVPGDLVEGCVVQRRAEQIHIITRDRNTQHSITTTNKNSYLLAGILNTQYLFIV